MPVIINGFEIDDEIIEQEFSGIKAAYESVPGAGCICDRDDEFRENARDNIIARALLTQQAEKLITDITSEEIEKTWQELVEEHGSVDATCYALGTTEDHIDEIKSNIKQQLQVNKLIEQLTADIPQPTRDLVQQWHADKADQYMTEEQVRVLHLMKNTPKVEQREQVFEEMRNLRKQLTAGQDFSTLAIQHSEAYKNPDEQTDEDIDLSTASDDDSNQSSDGIDLGYFSRGDIMEEFEVIAFSLEVDDISPVFMTHYGFHIIKVIDHIPAKQLPFGEIYDQLLEDYTTELKQNAINNYIKEIRKSADIQIIEPKPWYEELDESHEPEDTNADQSPAS